MRRGRGEHEQVGAVRPAEHARVAVVAGVYHVPQLDRVVALATPLPSEPCPVGSGFGRVLDEDVVARFAG